MKNALESKRDISYQSAGKFEETRFEKIHNEIFKNSIEASIIVAQEIAQLILSISFLFLLQKVNYPLILELCN